MIQSGDFVRLVSNKGYKKEAIKAGDVFYVAGTKQLPIKKNNPYLFMTYIIILLIKDGEIQIPNGENGYTSYEVDPRKYEKLSEEDSEIYKGMLRKQFS